MSATALDPLPHGAPQSNGHGGRATDRDARLSVGVEAEHLCMTVRGVQKPGAKTVTSTLSGLLREDPRTREEFMGLIGGRIQ